MKYKIIEIKPDGKDAWKYIITDIVSDRVSKKTEPSALGYYYYPETIPDEQAFNTLKECMINTHKDQIERTKRSMYALEKIQL